MSSKRALWRRHDGAWRHPGQILTQWPAGDHLDPKLLESRIHGAWWSILDKAGITLIVSREYEHFVMAMSVAQGAPRVSYIAVPHPSGIAVDRNKGKVFIASTRNPNQILELAPARSMRPRSDARSEAVSDKPLIPVRTQFAPGCLYIHDLALIGGTLHAAAAGMNAIVRVDSEGAYPRLWWPRSLDKSGAAAFHQNYLQLNSIAAGRTLQESYFCASAESPQRLRPGNPHFPVDGRGVIFSGKTRQVLARGLTRPHSTRLYGGRVWVNNSGYGEVGIAGDGRFFPVAKLPGWTRGLCFAGDVAFVGISRVIPRFRAYAPGLQVDKSRCGIYALNAKTGQVLGAITWPNGNQIFALDWVPRSLTAGFAFARQKGSQAPARTPLFYAYSLIPKGATR